VNRPGQGAARGGLAAVDRETDVGAREHGAAKEWLTGCGLGKHRPLDYRTRIARDRGVAPDHLARNRRDLGTALLATAATASPTTPLLTRLALGRARPVSDRTGSVRLARRELALDGLRAPRRGGSLGFRGCSLLWLAVDRLVGIAGPATAAPGSAAIRAVPGHWVFLVVAGRGTRMPPPDG
jgi:hypothetical protein